MIVSGDCLFVGGSGVRVFGMDEMFFSYLSAQASYANRDFREKNGEYQAKLKYF
jgi:hypothetical protein